jgi:protein-tyrosine phosphatase
MSAQPNGSIGGSIFEGSFNARDVGDTPLAGGGRVAEGVLFRADALARLTDRGVRQLGEAGIGTVVDFRTPTERTEFTAVHLSLLEGAMSIPSGPLSAEAIQAFLATPVPAPAELYVQMLENGEKNFATVARLVAQGPDTSPQAPSRTGVLVHCTAGKDRTGVAVALLLEAAGADREAVVADYAASQEYLAGTWAQEMLARVEAAGLPATEEMTALMTSTPPEAVRTALAWVDERGGVDAYLREGGLAADDLDRLRGRLRGE